MAEISEHEKCRRREGNACVLGTHAMEDIFPDQEALDILNRYAEGELSLDEFSEALDRHALRLATKSGHGVSGDWFDRNRNSTGFNR